MVEFNIPGKLVLAPMAGVTDLAFREVCREQGAAFAYTEMVSAKALIYQDKKTRELILSSPADTPVAIQIFGSEPEIMAAAAAKAYSITPCAAIDINMGCPTGKIVKNGEGSALMRSPELAGRIVEAVVSAVSVPVTVKIRKGWDKGSVNAVEVARVCQSAGASAIAVHGRTRAQMYAGTVDKDIIREVKRSVTIPVIANGDVFDPEDAKRLLDYTGADAVMIGRGALGEPWIFSRASAALSGSPIPPKPSVRERAETAMRQFRRASELKGEKIACLEARKHYCWYLRGIAYSGYYKEQIIRACTLDDLERITDGIKRDLR